MAKHGNLYEPPKVKWGTCCAKKRVDRYQKFFQFSIYHQSMWYTLATVMPLPLAARGGLCLVAAALAVAEVSWNAQVPPNEATGPWRFKEH